MIRISIRFGSGSINNTVMEILLFLLICSVRFWSIRNFVMPKWCNQCILFLYNYQTNVCYLKTALFTSSIKQYYSNKCTIWLWFRINLAYMFRPIRPSSGHQSLRTPRIRLVKINTKSPQKWCSMWPYEKWVYVILTYKQVEGFSDKSVRFTALNS
jgi:hypothetical protein